MRKRKGEGEGGKEGERERENCDKGGKNILGHRMTVLNNKQLKLIFYDLIIIYVHSNNIMNIMIYIVTFFQSMQKYELNDF